MATDTDIAQADLADLLNILGMGDHARPQSPHEVFQEALGVLRERLMPTPRPLSEWTEEDGDVLWWRFPVEEPPYFGSPLCLGQTVEVEFRQHGAEATVIRKQVGGWPGYHTHWTRIPGVREP